MNEVADICESITRFLNTWTKCPTTKNSDGFFFFKVLKQMEEESIHKLINHEEITFCDNGNTSLIVIVIIMHQPRTRGGSETTYVSMTETVK